MSGGVLVGNPNPNSRTLAAAVHVATRLSGDTGVAAATQQVRSVDLLVVASPTYKASISGMLKPFLDQLPAGGLDRVTAIPVMLGRRARPHANAGVHAATRPHRTRRRHPRPISLPDWRNSDTGEQWLPTARRSLTGRPVPTGAPA